MKVTKELKKKLIQKPNEINSQETEIIDDDLADDTK